MNENVQLDPQTRITLACVIGSFGLILLGFVVWNWSSWGHVVALISFVVFVLTMIERAISSMLHKHSERKSIKQHHDHAEHYRELTTRALAMGHSIQMKHVDHMGGTWEVSTISPFTIPNAPVNIENLSFGDEDIPQIAAPLTLPDKMLLVDVIRRWNLTPHNLFLGLGKGSKEIACSLEGLMHVAHDAPTGGGKTSQWLAEIVQLLKLNVQVILCNPHFAPVDKKGNDWRPVGQAIEAQGWIQLADDLRIPGLIRNYENIANILKWLSVTEIDRRFNLQAQGIYSYKPLYIFIDEWPSVVRRYPDAGEYLTDVLQRGRAVEVNIDTNAQGFLQTDVNLQGSARENFNTAYHMGGTVHSGAKLLDMPVKDYNTLLRNEQVTLGRGIALLRNNESCPQAELVRLPLAENMYTYYMLGRADNWVLPEFRTRNLSGNFGNQTVSGNLSDDFRNAEKEDIEPVYANVSEISEFRKTTTLERKVEVKPEIRNEIIRLRKQGYNRTEIRDILHFNGEQFRMIKTVLDEEAL